MSKDEHQEDATPRPRDTAIKVVLDLIPYVGGALSTLYDDHLQRRRERATETIVETLDQLDDPEELIRRLRSDEIYADAFVESIEAASKSSVAAKRRAFARILAEGLEEVPEELDETLLLVQVLKDLDLIHLRTLHRIGEFDSPRLRSLVVATPEPVFAVLRRHGLLEEGTTYDGHVAIEGLSNFGVKLLRYIEDAGSVPPE